MSSPHNNADADASDEFFRRMNPLHQWSSFFPSAASTLFGVGNCATATDTANNNNNNNNNNESNNENKEMDNKIKNQNNYKSNYKNNYKTNSASQRQPTTTADDHPDMLLFDAVPFNGDTDNRTNSYITHFQNNTNNGNTNNGNNATIPDTDFRNVDITIAIPVKLRHRSSMGSNTSNISPIGNVSSRMLFHTNTNTNYCNNNDCPSDESDDDLDRILGTQNHPPPPPHRNTTIPHNTQPMPMHMRRMRMSGKRMGAAKADNKLPSSSSSSSGELNETMPTVYSENSLDDDDDDDDGKGKHLKDRFRARCNWWIVLCVVLVLVGSILIGAMVPFSGDPRQNQAQNSNSTNNTNSGAGNGGSGSSGINSSTSPANTSSLTTSPTKAPLVQPSLRPTLPLEEIVANEIDNEIDNDNDSATQQPQIRLDMGPMVGHTTHDSVTLWAYYVKPAMYLLEENYAIEILLYDSDGRVTTTFVEADPNRQRYNPVFATLTNLEALEVYRYEMRILGQGVGSGSFKTASAPPLETTAARTAAATTTRTEKEGGRKLQTTGTTFEYVLASCMDRSEQPTQKVWDAIPTTNADGTKDYPDFAILAGDTIYLQEGIDIVNFWGVRFDRYWYRNREQRTEPHFAKFVANTPIYAVWNNHDYGAETANMGQAGKEESLRAWKSLWPNPAYPGSSNSNMNNNNSNNNSNNGIYYSFYRGDVHYIVTDDHWNRDPFRENRWGAKQTDWITSELLSSRGTFKVIVLGSDILERGWSSDLDTIGAVVTKHSINGVLFNAGDIHRNEYKRKTGHGFPYPVTQITSSGIAKVWRKPFAKITVDTTLDDPMITVRFFGAANMEADTTWINDSEMVCSAIEGVEDREKEHSCTETIRLSDLSVAS